MMKPDIQDIAKASKLFYQEIFEDFGRVSLQVAGYVRGIRESDIKTTESS